MRKILVCCLALLASLSCVHAEDRVLTAARDQVENTNTPATLQLSLSEARNYATESNRTLKNASLAVQEAYAARWQTIASMLPQADASAAYQDYLGYKAQMSTAMGEFSIEMPNSITPSISASMGLSGQAVMGIVLNNLAIDMKKISLEQSEDELRGNVTTAYVTVLALEGITTLLDSTMMNIESLYHMTQRSVEVGAAEQTDADQLKVRLNMMKTNINTQKNSIALAINSLKVLLDVPVETEIVLTDRLESILSAESVLNLLGADMDINRNLNYQLLQKSTDLAHRNMEMAAWAYGPTLGVSYQHTFGPYYFGDGGMRMTPPNLVAVSLSVPLWSSGKRAASVIEKKIAWEEAKNTLSETRDNLGIQYHQLLNNLTTSYQTYLNQNENLEVTHRVLNSMANKYQYGVASNLELTQASNDLITAESDYINAVMNLVSAQVELEKFLNN